jgi:hypothetical protein
MFYRTIRMMENGIKPVYVFDGKPPLLKGGEVKPLTLACIPPSPPLPPLPLPLFLFFGSVLTDAVRNTAG